MESSNGNELPEATLPAARGVSANRQTSPPGHGDDVEHFLTPRTGPDDVGPSHQANDDEEDEPSYNEIRPNKHQGVSSTWRDWTHNERQLSSSIFQQRSSDLSIHLFNAHALKARLRDAQKAAKAPSWAAKESWIRVPHNKDEEDGKKEDDSFYPTHRWTEWPMPADVVPREGEKVGWDRDEDDGRWTFKRMERERPSRVLEEVLMAGVLRTAKERYESREWEDEDAEVEEQEQKQQEEDVEMGDEGTVRSKTIRSSGIERPSDTEVEDEGNESRRSVEQKSPLDSDHQRPVVMADDDEARMLLRPTVRHILSKLDDLLMGLHQARQGYANMSGRDSSSHRTPKRKGSHVEQNSTNDQPSKRKLGRPRKEIDMTMIMANPSNIPADGSANDDNSITKEPRKGKRGPASKYPRPQEGASYWTIRRRILEAQAQAQAREEPPSANESDSDDPRPQHHDDPDAPSNNPQHNHLGLRDWSDVLGIASMTGWDEAVISRAAERCSVLFNEKIQSRTLATEAASYPRHDREKTSSIVEYPRPSPLRETTTTTVSEGQQTTKFSPTHQEAAPLQARVYTAPTGRKFFLCPHPTCPRHQASVQGFRKRYHLNRHLQLVHGAEKGSKVEVQEEEEEVDEEMLGGVHVDGFLKPVPPLKKARASGKKREKEEKGDEDGDGDGAEGLQEG
ncbi:MAG: hypothetical protein M1816_001339 [Peltula sp. TS41687]|nr:MAG: hypothetical protein M1816_001339 [Peltula sp. TS41687]